MTTKKTMPKKRKKQTPPEKEPCEALDTPLDTIPKQGDVATAHIVFRDGKWSDLTGGTV